MNPTESKRKIIVFTATGVILFNVVLIIYVLLGDATHEVNAAPIITAVSAYKQLMTRSHQPIPATVSAQDLIARGLLSPDDVKGFGAGEITISLTHNLRPSDPIIRVRRTDGHEISVLADGSIQDVKR